MLAANTTSALDETTTSHESGNIIDRPLLSIIMPLYNVQDFAHDALTSLLKTKRLNFELILIDDASTDATLTIARKFAAADKRVRLIALEHNKGVAYVRNLGLKQVRSPWIWMPDSDDSFADGVLDTLVSLLERIEEESCQPDVIIFGHREQYYKIKQSDKALVPSFSLEHLPTLTPNDFRRNKALALMQLEQENHLGYPYNKLYKRSLISNNALEFENLPLLEDFFFNIQYFSHVDNILCIPEILYTYHKRQTTSLTTKFVPEYFSLHRRRIEELYNFAHHITDGLSLEYKQVLGSLYARYILSALERNIQSQQGLEMSNQELYRFLKNDSLFRELMPCAHAKSSKALDLWILVLNKGTYASWIAFATMLSLLKRKAQGIVTRIKSNR